MNTENKMEARTIITSNGSRWLGEEPASIEELVELMGKEPLDISFEKYGNFIMRNPQHAVYLGNGKYKDTGPIFPGEDMTRFWGNFANLSHVFQIESSEPAVIELLTDAIRRNQKRADYISQMAQA